MIYILVPFLLAFGFTARAQSQAELFSRDSIHLVQELMTMAQEDQKYRSNLRKYKAHQQEQSALDDRQTARMIEMIQTYGFPSRKRFTLNKKTHLAPHIILVHAPEKYFDTLKTLVKAEKEAGRMGVDEFAHVIWHLNGRVGIPDFEGVRIKVGKRKTVITNRGE
jgi:hypothetical protein